MTRSFTPKAVSADAAVPDVASAAGGVRERLGGGRQEGATLRVAPGKAKAHSVVLAGVEGWVEREGEEGGRESLRRRKRMRERERGAAAWPRARRRMDRTRGARRPSGGLWRPDTRRGRGARRQAGVARLCAPAAAFDPLDVAAAASLAAAPRKSARRPSSTPTPRQRRISAARAPSRRACAARRDPLASARARHRRFQARGSRGEAAGERGSRLFFCGWSSPPPSLPHLAARRAPLPGGGLTSGCLKLVAPSCRQATAAKGGGERGWARAAEAGGARSRSLLC
jgi:hypothetical protein